MLFAGLQKLTLLDYPEHVACTVFTQGCNLRCPFCHNSSLIDPFREPEIPIEEEEILSLLRKRQGVLDGICLTGGEPLMHEQLADFLEKVRAMGFLVKLDTNGCYPERLSRLIDAGLVNMVAMDIKNAPDAYGRTVGLPGFNAAPIKESAAVLMQGRIPFEFRTTVSIELHREESFDAIGQWLRGDWAYFLQYYKESEQVLHKGLHAPTEEKMRRFLSRLLPYLPNARIRGE